ncbi:hypothetical protein BKA61DRAFT_714226 [Leptodontidium sp. MPI-SDFR-AT-0119]|nr:hypothetical protein BKA61DRAFT_714226 [Leptodontidium sp. MPI-SDFR-AT-0119]
MSAMNIDNLDLPSGPVILGSSAHSTPNTPRLNNHHPAGGHAPSSPINNTIRGSQLNLNQSNSPGFLNIPSFTNGGSQPSFSTSTHSARPHRSPIRKSKRPSEAPMELPTAKFLRHGEPTTIRGLSDRIMNDLALIVSKVQEPEYRNSFIQVLATMEQINSGFPITKASNMIVNAANHMEQIIAKASRHFPREAINTSFTPSSSDSSDEGAPTESLPRPLFSAQFNTSQHGKRVTILDPKPNRQQQLKAKKQLKRDHTVILIKHTLTSFTDINPLELRSKINEELSKQRHAITPVLATITKSIAQNLILTTTAEYSAEYLIQQSDILAKFIQFKEAKKDISFFKVAVHGVTLQLDTPEMPQMIRDEINTFNKSLNLNIVGTPYWLTSESKRLGPQKAASMIIAFATEEEQTRAIRNRLNIGGMPWIRPSPAKMP